ncbi:MAG: hypothetical protein JWP01_1819 [Myxococcales bacterium]|nr:hypothetical protein [Myxococcales bacterium]
MLPRQIIAVSPDKELGQKIAAALRGEGRAVGVHATLESVGAGGIEAELCVLDLGGDPTAITLVPRLIGRCPVIVVLPRSDLAAAVDLMQAHDRIAGMIVAEELDPAQLAATGSRLLDDRLFGLASVMPPETKIHAIAVGDHVEKLRCITHIVDQIVQIGAPRSLHAPIEQCLDEMLMNALYDAPVDAQGKHIFSGVATRSRILMRTEHTVTVEYAYDGRRFAVAVRDSFGSLERATMLRFLHKCLHSPDQMDRKAGGAGVGLYLMVNAASVVQFTVLPGIATEALCVFDLQAPAARLQELGFFRQTDLAGQVASGPARAVPSAAAARARRRRLVRRVGTGIAATAFTVAAVLGARRLIRGHVPDPVPTVEIDSKPTGALIEIDGVPFGSTPVTLTSLAEGKTLSIAFTQRGYRAATASLQVPVPGEVAKLVQPLELSDDFVRVRFVSDPLGAEIIQTGQLATVDRTYTPADVFVEAAKLQRFTLRMPKHVPVVIEPFTPERGAKGLEKGGELVPGVTLRVEAAGAGTVTVRGAPHCTAVAVPLDCTVAPGTYDVDYVGPDQSKVTRSVVIEDTDLIERF